MSQVPSAASQPAASTGLRQVGLLPLLFLLYAYTTGGPFAYEEIFSLSGPGMAVAFLAFVPLFFSIPMSLAAAELNSILPVEGGFYRWSRAAFGNFWGFQVGWWNWTGTFLLNASYGVAFVDYVGPYVGRYLAPHLAPYLGDLAGFTGLWRWLGAVAFLGLLAYANVRGIQVAGWIAVALQLMILVPVVWLCVVALLKWQQNPLVPFVPPDRPLGSVFGAGLALAMWNYAGYEQFSSVAEEVRDPRRTYLRALAWVTPMAVLTYVLPCSLALAALGNWAEWKTGYITVAAGAVGGPALGVAMLVASIIGVASLSNSTILSTTRMPFAMAQDGYLPRWLAALHPRFGTPTRAIALSLVVYCALAATDVVTLVAIYIWSRIATSFMTLLAVAGLRRTMPSAPRSFRIPGGNLGLAYIIFLPAILFALKVYYSEPLVYRYAPWLLAAGPAAYLVLRYAFGLRPRPAEDG